MGSPLGPVLANVFMGHHEKMWISNCVNSKPSFYCRYVDDVFTLFENEAQSLLFLEYLNIQHPNIKFTRDPQVDGKLPFLDVCVDINNGSNPSTSIYRKHTFTGVMLNYLSYNPLCYKISLVKTLIHRIFMICSTWQIFHVDLSALKHILERNMFPPKVIESEIRSYLEKKLGTENQCNQNKNEVRFFKLPYLKDISESARKNINSIQKTLCKSDVIRLSFSTFKIGSVFSAKDKLEWDSKSFVVYRFICPGCNARYIGETTRHITTRIEEHSSTDKKSHIFKHINQSLNCGGLFDRSCFEIIDTANTEFRLKLKEAMHISWEKPILNKQVKSVQVSITV